MNDKDDPIRKAPPELFLRASQEFDTASADPALLAKASALGDGDPARTKAAYIRLRVEELLSCRVSADEKSQSPGPAITAEKPPRRDTFVRSLGWAKWPAIIAFAIGWTGAMGAKSSASILGKLILGVMVGTMLAALFGLLAVLAGMIILSIPPRSKGTVAALVTAAVVIVILIFGF